MTIRSFKNYSSERFNNDITKVPWSVLETFDDPEDKLHAFNLLFNEVLDRHAPLKTIRLRGRPNPYITDEIRDLMTTMATIINKKVKFDVGLHLKNVSSWQ